MTHPVLTLPEVSGHAISIRAKALTFQDPCSRLSLAYFTALAETIGGSQEFGPGVLEQQWNLAKAIRRS